MTLTLGLRRLLGAWALLVALLVGGTGASVANSLPTTITVTLSASDITYPATATAEVKLGGVFQGLSVGGQFELYVRRSGVLKLVAPYPTGGNTTFPIPLDATQLVGSTALVFRFSGDKFYEPSQTAEIPFKATGPSSVEIFSNSNPADPGAAVKFTVKATSPVPGSVPTGDVNVFRNGELYAKIALGFGVVNFNVPAEKVAGTWTATYLGNVDYGLLSSTSGPWVQTVKAPKTATSVGLVATPNPVEVGKPVTLTAVVTDNANFLVPTGTVTFAIDGASLPPKALDAAGVVIFDAGSFSLGTHTVTATYSGSDFLLGSASPPVSVTVNKASTTVALAGSAAQGVVPFGAPLFATATVSSALGDGNIELRDGSPQKLVGFTSTSGGVANFDLSGLEPGEHYLTAYFYGNSLTAPSESGAIYYAVAPSDSATTIAASTYAARLGEPVTFTATVAPVAPAIAVPTGTVTFKRGSTVLGTATLAGGAGLAVASLDVADLPVGVSAVSATFDGGVGFKPSKSAAISVTVGLKVGDELLVNTITKGPQTAPALSAGLSGGALVVWESATAAGKDKSIVGRLVSPAGVPTGKEIKIVTAGKGVAAPKVTGLASGDYAVVWQAGPDADRDVFLALYTAAGKPKGSPVVVNTDKAGNQTAPAVALLGSGDFVVAWQSDDGDADGSGILAQRFDKTGKAKGKVIAVNTTAKGDQVAPVATPLSTGGFAIGWSGPLKAGNSAFFQAYTKTGKAKGKEVVIDTKPMSALPRLALTVSDGGGVIAAWDEPDKKGSADRNAYLAAFSGTGQKLGSVQIDPAKKGDQSEPALVPIAGPKLAVVWTTADADESGVSLAVFSVTAARVIPATPVNTTTAKAQSGAVVTPIGVGADAGKTFLAVWETDGQDGSLGGIALQAFGAP